MADIAATDVTYTIQRRRVVRGAGTENIVQLVFGDNTLTYPTNGIPLTKAKLGCLYNLDSLVVLDQGANAKGYTFEWDKTNNKLRVMVRGGFTPAGTVAAPTFTGDALAVHGHVLHLKNADQTDAANNRVNAAAGKLGANTGSDIDIAAVANVSGSGGIVSLSAGTPAGSNSAPAFTGTAVAAAALIEHANATFVPNPATLIVVAVGY